MCTIVNVVTDAVVIFIAHLWRIMTITNIVEVFIASVSVVFVASQFSQTRSREEWDHINLWSQHNLKEWKIEWMINDPDIKE